MPHDAAQNRIDASDAGAATGSTTLGAAVAQFAPGTDVGVNLETIGGFARRAAALGASLLVLPEYSSYFTAELGPSFAEHAQPVDGSFVRGIEALADETGLHIVVGLVETTPVPERFSNTLVAVAPGEGVVARYRKVHLYDAFGQRESDWVVPGETARPETFVVDGLRFGLQTCYDLRFPESTRVLADAGADVVMVPAEWVRGPLKEHHWRTLVTARAVENTVYVLAADHTPPVGVGASMIVDPMGVQLAGLGEEAGVVVAQLSKQRISDVRAVNPALDLRRYRVEPVSLS
ncbi:carbon-nitrogen hydrolase family protein [Plantibacter sp. Mn2098]|uniref:carbon-nitrogen hydrolase family protein n=1 Tax=Plantibacter sp. Mn2098 TaxID=3395266 RepID=UPI003BC7C870